MRDVRDHARRGVAAPRDGIAGRSGRAPEGPAPPRSGSRDARISARIGAICTACSRVRGLQGGTRAALAPAGWADAPGRFRSVGPTRNACRRYRPVSSVDQIPADAASAIAVMTSSVAPSPRHGPDAPGTIGPCRGDSLMPMARTSSMICPPPLRGWAATVARCSDDSVSDRPASAGLRRTEEPHRPWFVGAGYFRRCQSGRSSRERRPWRDGPRCAWAPHERALLRCIRIRSFGPPDMRFTSLGPAAFPGTRHQARGHCSCVIFSGSRLPLTRIMLSAGPLSDGRAVPRVLGAGRCRNRRSIRRSGRGGRGSWQSSSRPGRARRWRSGSCRP